MENSYAVVLTTTNSEEEARKLAKHILTERLGACVQIQKIESHYIWKGEICSDQEYLLFIKTRRDLYKKLEESIKTKHTYETPEIIEIPITGGLARYFSWIDESTK